jgi:hypothetical protein
LDELDGEVEEVGGGHEGWLREGVSEVRKERGVVGDGRGGSPTAVDVAGCLS